MKFVTITCASLTLSMGAQALPPAQQPQEHVLRTLTVREPSAWAPEMLEPRHGHDSAYPTTKIVQTWAGVQVTASASVTGNSI